ncbi:MAG TPA: 2-succinyl-5-enolpyruvyl-6-hydroxy-3-cyclohexene-1-carboxylic-acid synthase [Kofleriaceae bacterium]|nr:2-succinyl-5-enolpyruvyl-6-hydroxy-3-cyclohexene-1-carboxylic-acid synthase [Kofleriaceae bacterium]
MNLPWAELLLGGLRDAGAGDLIVSPGSRSTPLVLAAARLGLACHVIIDERVAGFFALGRARVTGRPSVLVCTSGTAAAHYLPAVIEAAMARVPLVIVTADRPPELRDCGAPQTIDQAHLFGRFARGFCDLGVPEAVVGALRGVRRRAAQMAALSGWPDPGPVHINAPARVPLEPAAEPGTDERRMIDLAAAVAAEPLTRTRTPPRRADEAAIAELVEACRQARRGLLVAGPAGLVADSGDSSDSSDSSDSIAALARATGFPLLAEATSQLRWTGSAPPAGLCDAVDLVVRGGRRGAAALAPDLIVELGAPPTSGAWSRYVAEHRGCRRIVIAPHGWLDPHSGASLLVQADVGDTAARVASRLGAAHASGGREEWREAWRDANRRARECLERAMGEAATGEATRGQAAGGETTRGHAASGEATRGYAATDAATRGHAATDEAASHAATDAATGEHAAVRAAVDALPDGALLVLGNSLPVRVADAACPASARRIGVLHQRGACGIDGLIAGAAGAASAAGRPTALILGDVSFAHDLGGLAAARVAGAPLAVVVIDNAGGRIFEHLPVASAPGGAEALERFYLTAPQIDLGAAAAAFGVAYRRATDPTGLTEAVRAALASPGATLIHAPVAPHSARDVERAALALLAEAA